MVRCQTLNDQCASYIASESTALHTKSLDESCMVCKVWQLRWHAGLKWGRYWRTTTNLLYVAMLDTKLDILINNAANVEMNIYCIVENFWGRKILQLLSFVAICESFLRKIWGHGIHWWRQWAIHKTVLRKNVFSTSLWKSSPAKDSCYTLVWRWVIPVTGTWTSHFLSQWRILCLPKCQPWMHICRLKNCPDVS